MLAIVAMSLVAAYVKLFAKQANYQKTVTASIDSVLVLPNLDRSAVKIVTGTDDKIKIDLKGSAQDILSVLQTENGIYTTLEFADDSSSKVTGTITVPEGMLLDISLSDDKRVTVDDISGKKAITDKNSFLVDTSHLNSMTVDDSGNVTLVSGDDLIVWDDKTWDVLDNNGSNEDKTPEVVYCGIGSQAIRNYCCETEKSSDQDPACEGLGHWIFDNPARDCAFVCEADEGGEPAEPVDCGIGSQVERNSCCSSQHVGEYQGCIGSWRYNNASQDCQFDCDTFQSPSDDLGDVGDEGEGSDSFSYGDSVSDYCVGVINAENRDLCCNNALKNNLSSGPHPGFPDCIGTWKFDSQLGCKFECAEHAEMMEILNELKQKAQQNND